MRGLVHVLAGVNLAAALKGQEAVDVVGLEVVRRQDIVEIEEG